MTQEEILEYNKLCAEFLGITTGYFKSEIDCANPEYQWMCTEANCTYEIQKKDFPLLNVWDYLKFHSDWNWIMEMLDKVALLDFGWKLTSKYVNIYSHTGDPRGEFDCTHSINCPENVMLDTVRTINQFLIWYNENKK